MFKRLAFSSGEGYEKFLLSAFLYYINSLQYICTSFIIRPKKLPHTKKTCYFWRKQNLRGHSDFVLFVLSLILAQGTLNIWAQTQERFILGNSTWLLSVWWFSDLCPCTRSVYPYTCPLIYGTLTKSCVPEPVLVMPSSCSLKKVKSQPERSGSSSKAVLCCRTVDGERRHPSNPGGIRETRAKYSCDSLGGRYHLILVIRDEDLGG